MSNVAHDNYWRGVREGALEERERIIKLIEEENKFLYELEIEYVIALIKGSQNVGAEIDNPSEGENK